MGKKIQLSEAALTKIIKESVMAEIDRRAVMPGKYYEIFKNRIINAQHGNFGDVDRTIMEFFKDFKDRIPNEGFTLENLKDLAEKIEGGGTTHERSDMEGGHKIKDADGWWRRNAGKYLEEKKVRLTEGQLRKLIKESVMKALVNEISSDMIGRAKNKFYQKYGGTDFLGPDAKDFPKDEHGNLLYPKDKKPLASHYRNFDQAIDRAKQDEQMNDPVTREAMEIWNEVENDVDWDITDDFGNEGCEVSGYIEVDGWEFSAYGYAERAGGLEVEEIESVEFKSPDGQEGSFRP